MDLIDYLGLLCSYSKAQSNTLSPVRSRVLTSVDSCPCRIWVGGRKSLLREGTPSETLPVYKLLIFFISYYKAQNPSILLFLDFVLLNIPLFSISITFSTQISAPLPATVTQLLW